MHYAYATPVKPRDFDLCYKVLDWFHARNPRFQPDDYFSFAWEGYRKALERFDRTKTKRRFESYAFDMIKYEIKTALRDQSRARHRRRQGFEHDMVNLPDEGWHAFYPAKDDNRLAIKALHTHDELQAAIRRYATCHQERVALQLRALGLPLLEVGAALGVTESRASQILRSVRERVAMAGEPLSVHHHHQEEPPPPPKVVPPPKIIIPRSTFSPQPTTPAMIALECKLHQLHGRTHP